MEKIKKFFRTIAIMLLLAILIVIGVRFFFMSVTHTTGLSRLKYLPARYMQEQ